MNATSLYVSTCRLMVNGVGADANELFRLLPYLRAALSCAVCGGLLKCAASPSPSPSACPHAVCKACRNGRKRLKPACASCRDLHSYDDNVHLRILLQCYKRLCDYFKQTDAFRRIAARTADPPAAGLVDLIQEGAGFSDGYETAAPLTRTNYSVLPCVYTNSSTQTRVGVGLDEEEPPRVYSVTYAPTGNKITIKRKQPDDDEESSTSSSVDLTPFKKPTYRSRPSAGKRKGCRCGNATATPGKLTCCGQRCPCYVESKPCSECKCKGCRNPHRPDGIKIRPCTVDTEEAHVVPVRPESSPPSTDNELTDSEPMLACHSGHSNVDHHSAYSNQSCMVDEEEADSPSSQASEEGSSSPEPRDTHSPLLARRSFALTRDAFVAFHYNLPNQDDMDEDADM